VGAIAVKALQEISSGTSPFNTNASADIAHTVSMHACVQSCSLTKPCALSFAEGD